MRAVEEGCARWHDLKVRAVAPARRRVPGHADDDRARAARGRLEGGALPPLGGRRPRAV